MKASVVNGESKQALMERSLASLEARESSLRAERTAQENALDQLRSDSNRSIAKLEASQREEKATLLMSLQSQLERDVESVEREADAADAAERVAAIRAAHLRAIESQQRAFDNERQRAEQVNRNSRLSLARSQKQQIEQLQGKLDRQQREHKTAMKMHNDTASGGGGQSGAAAAQSSASSGSSTGGSKGAPRRGRRNSRLAISSRDMISELPPALPRGRAVGSAQPRARRRSSRRASFTGHVLRIVETLSDEEEESETSSSAVLASSGSSRSAAAAAAQFVQLEETHSALVVEHDALKESHEKLKAHLSMVTQVTEPPTLLYR